MDYLRGQRPIDLSNDKNHFDDIKGTMYDFSDTSKMRGTWFKMLIDASKADKSSREEKIIVCGQFRTLCEYFPCAHCKQHFKMRLLNYPPELVINDKDGLFMWTYEFMNSVNLRLNKPLYEYSITYSIFHISGSEPSLIATDNQYDTLKGTIYDFSDTSKMKGTWFKMLLDASKAYLHETNDSKYRNPSLDNVATEDNLKHSMGIQTEYPNRLSNLIVCGQFRTLCEYIHCDIASENSKEFPFCNGTTVPLQNDNNDCQQHFINYLLNNPPELVIDNKDGLFIWTFEFMNSINSKLGKPLYDYNKIYPIFHIAGYSLCNSYCHSNTVELNKTTQSLNSNMAPIMTSAKRNFQFVTPHRVL